MPVDFETSKCGICHNQSFCWSLCGISEHACLEANSGLWFLLGAGNGNLINSSQGHLSSEGCCPACAEQELGLAPVTLILPWLFIL